jgi:hypothetical protein
MTVAKASTRPSDTDTYKEAPDDRKDPSRRVRGRSDEHPAWALPSQAPSNQGTRHAPSTTPAGPPSTTPNNADNPGSANRRASGDHGNKDTPSGSGPDNQSPASDPGQPDHPGHPTHPTHPSHPGHPGTPHKCVPHSVAYVASGTLVSQTLSKNADGTCSGGVTVNVTHTNHHAAGDEVTTKTYTVAETRVTFGLSDTNHYGSVGLDDLQAGDRVKVIGGITALAKKCDQSSFTAQTTIRRIIFHTPTS